MDHVDQVDQASKSAASSGPPAHGGHGPGGPPEVSWIDDREWLYLIRHAPDEATKRAVLAAWVASAGGETRGQTVTLPALSHHSRRQLAELELRRMCRQLGLEVLEEEA